MSWVRIDDGAPDHPKLLAAGAEACWLWVCGLAYCNRVKKRDGFIPEVKVALLYPARNASKLASKLVEVGLWERAPGGYRVHDYHEYQPSEDLRRARSEAGKKGGMKSGLVRRGEANDEATPKQLASIREATASNPIPSRPDPDPQIPEGDPPEASPPPPPNRISSAGAFDLVTAFVEGASSIPGVSYPTPFGRPFTSLGAAIAARARADGGIPRELARALGARWVSYCGGAPDGPLAAIDWIGKGAPASRVLRGRNEAVPQAVGPGGRIWKAGQDAQYHSGPKLTPAQLRELQFPAPARASTATEPHDDRAEGTDRTERPDGASARLRDQAL